MKQSAGGVKTLGEQERLMGGNTRIGFIKRTATGGRVHRPTKFKSWLAEYAHYLIGVG